MSTVATRRVSIKNLATSSIRRLPHVFRYSSIHTTRKESVAEHTTYVAMYSLILAKDLIARGTPVRLDVLLERALLHDVDESLTGDFLRTVKYGHPGLKDALDQVSVKMIERMEAELSVPLKESWESAKNDDIEGSILELTDLFCVLVYVFEELMCGNKHILFVVNDCCDYINEFSAKHSNSPILYYADSIVEWARSERSKYV